MDAVDADYALALRLDQELKEEDEDRRMALRLQEEEDLMADQVRRRGSGAPRYRNANFVDFGHRSGDDAVSSRRDSLRRLSGNSLDHGQFYPEPNDSMEEGL